MVDNTREFRAVVSSLRTASGKDASSDLMRPVRPRSRFSAQAVQTLCAIRDLNTFLLEHLGDYVQLDRYAADDGAALSDEQRDAIDAEAFEFAKACSQRIGELRKLVEKDSAADDQERTHRENVVAYLYERLRTVADVLKQQRKLRMKQLLLTRDRLATEAERADVESSDDESADGAAPSGVAGVGESDSKGPGHMTFGVDNSGAEDEWLNSADGRELRQMEAENSALAAELETDAQAVRSMEKKMVEISQLLEFFSEKVMEQHEQVEHLYDSAVRSREQVNKGNEELVEATQHSASFRVFTLLFLIIASALLLFLDWYS